MQPSDKDTDSKPPKREQELAQALRANLRRRKAGQRSGSEKTTAAKSGDAD